MKPEITLSPGERTIVRGILADNLPAGTMAFVIGSRAGGRPKPWSDLDIVLEASEPLPFAVLGSLAEAFDEALLAWKVDLIDRRAVSPEFAAIVDRTKVPFDFA